MRRLILEQPVSAAALWSRRLAGFALALGIIGLTLARGQYAEMTAALGVFGAAIIIACLAVLAALTAAVVIWRTGRRGLGLLLSGLAMAAILLAYPAFLSIQAIRLPLLNDVSTDLIDPPEFSRSSRALAARGSNERPSIPISWRESQRRAYPSVQPILLDMEAEEAWPLVQKAVAARGWRIIEQTPAGGRSGIRRLEAVDRTALMGFSDDVTIRARPLAGQTRIDLRSASRIGRHDFGANARRIQAFARDLQAQLDAR